MRAYFIFTTRTSAETFLGRINECEVDEMTCRATVEWLRWSLDNGLTTHAIIDPSPDPRVTDHRLVNIFDFLLTLEGADPI